MKFIKEHLAAIEGVATYPMISLLIFFVFFALLFLWVFTAKKAYLDQMSNLPLDSTNSSKNEK